MERLLKVKYIHTLQTERARLLAGKIIYTAWTGCPSSGWGCRKEGGEMRYS